MLAASSDISMAGLDELMTAEGLAMALAMVGMVTLWMTGRRWR